MYIQLLAWPLDGRSIATELAELRKSQHFEEKTIFTEHPVLCQYTIHTYKIDEGEMREDDVVG